MNAFMVIMILHFSLEKSYKKKKIGFLSSQMIRNGHEWPMINIQQEITTLMYPRHLEWAQGGLKTAKMSKKWYIQGVKYTSEENESKISSFFV